jgi:hypothetical protein
MDRKTVRVWGGRLLMVTAACWRFDARVVPSYAQVDTGSILGTVSDSSGARVASATTLTNKGRMRRSTTTADDGSYKFTRSGLEATRS